MKDVIGCQSFSRCESSEYMILLHKQMPSGSHEVKFAAKELPSGVYLYRIVVDSYGESGVYHEVRKMILMK